MAGARFTQINLVAHDLEKTLAFYRLVGLEIPEDAIWRSGGHAHHVIVPDKGAVDLEFDSRKLAHVYNQGFAAERGRVMIGIELESREAVDALWEKLLNESVQGLQPPFDAFWGARYAIVEDPDGNPVGLTSPVDPAMRSPGPVL
jgi:predicted lactoylglutathione lyase